MDEPMTEEKLQEIRKRAEQATPGPWRGLYLSGDWVTGVRNSSTAAIGLAEEPFTAADQSFICHAREDIPVLLAEVGRLKTERDYWRRMVGSDARYTTKRITALLDENAAMREIVQAVANSEPTYGTEWINCHYCSAIERPEDFHHSPDCLVTKARAILAEQPNETPGNREEERQ